MLKTLCACVLAFAAACPALGQNGPQEKPGKVKEPPKPAPVAKPQTPPKPAPAAESKPQAAPQAQSAAELAIEAALDKKSQCEFVQTPLADVMDFFRDMHKINVVIDKTALAGASIDASSPVSLNVKDVTFRSALELVLRPLKLTWTIHHEVLLVTTPDEAGKMLVTKVYSVGDLVALPAEIELSAEKHEEPEKPEGPAPKEAKPAEVQRPMPALEPADPEEAAVRERKAFEALIDLITSTVAPASWDVGGGPGSIAVATVGGRTVLVVSQSHQVHYRLARLLDDLRKAAGERK